MNSHIFKPECRATAIGSLPHKDPIEASAFVLKYLPLIPAVPELPQLGFRATFCGPIMENLPALKEDNNREIFYFNTDIDASVELEKFYENFLSENTEYFKISYNRSMGLYNILDIIRNNNIKPEYIKTQIPGPITTGLTIKDNKGKSIIYNEEFMQVIIKTIIMKAKWQVEKIQKVCPEVIIFLDEPGLTNFGSSYFNLDRNYIINTINETAGSINALTGSHCCGNTDWSLLMESELDIISFDAYTYSGALSLYPDHLNNFLKKGGIIAWGIIPNSQEITKCNPDLLINKLEEEINILIKFGFSKESILESSLITPSCGLGNSSLLISKEVLSITQQVSNLLRNKYFNHVNF
ncbi:MAG: hypothetical protein HY934_02735 [Candidatus Firestonebacteria bacterium]|nr:hypothetical protein [Candidatus Firestonebacteria bacterium]